MCAYFSNSSDGEVFDQECSDCILWNKPCPVSIVQNSYNYDACNIPVARAILNDLVKQDENYKYIGCQMKPILDLLRQKADPKQLKLFE